MKSAIQNRKRYSEVIGLIPAGGQATRIGPLPCSKELYPIGFRSVDEGQSVRPKVVCHYLLEKMRLAGICKVYVVLGSGKWDIPAYLGDGTMVNMHLAYLMMRVSYGVPYTLDQAYHFVQNVLVAFGFPDIIFQPADAFVHLLARQARTNADIVLGLFPAHQPQKMDMVDLDSDGKVRSMVIKPAETKLHFAWILAVWTPVFTHFMHQYLSSTKKAQEQNDGKRQELTVGEVIQAAIRRDLRVEGVVFPDDTYLDIGTPDDLVKAVQWRVTSDLV